jgi:glycosyltransferase involved in cell wall biosynthesis
LAFLQALASLSNAGSEEYVLFLRPGEEAFLKDFVVEAWHKASLEPPRSLPTIVLSLLRDKGILRGFRSFLNKFQRQYASPAEAALFNIDQIRHQPRFEKWFARQKVDWILYTGPNALSFEARIPYVMPVHDLQHMLQPEFQEVSADGEWEQREYLFRNGIRNATLILVDSEVGKEDVLRFYGRYGVSADRIRILPFLPANYLSVDVPAKSRAEIRNRYGLPKRYLFYPAQFWPHKNHVRIIEAVALLRNESGSEIHVVFCGSNTTDIQKQTFHEVMKLVQYLKISGQIHYLGYVPDEDMACLYAEATGLVMPTFFGPTNIPVLEAWAFGCPVVTSDIRGIQEQVGDAGLLVDIRSVEGIAAGMLRVWRDHQLRDELARRGRRRLESYTPEEFQLRLSDIVRTTSKLIREGRNN